MTENGPLDSVPLAVKRAAILIYRLANEGALKQNPVGAREAGDLDTL
jgi:hypothetical protein